MPSPLTPAERFRRASLALAEAQRLANQVTERTPGRERGALINKTRTQYNQVRAALGTFLRRRASNTPEQQAYRQRAEQLIEQAGAALQHARRFST